MQPAVHGRRGDRLEKFEAAKLLKRHPPICPARRRIEPVECRQTPSRADHFRIAKFVNQLLAERTGLTAFRRYRLAPPQKASAETAPDAQVRHHPL